MSKILYVGNDLVNKTGYKTSMSLICAKLQNEGITVFRTSSKTNQILRLLDMIFDVIKYRKVSLVFIDTFSTKSFYYALIISQLCRLLNIPYVPVLRGGNLPVRILKSPYLSKLIFTNSKNNLAPSEYLVSEFSKSNFNTLFIPNTIEISHYSFLERTLDFPKIFWLRAFKSLYNPKMAVEVLHRVKKKYSEAKLCMVGPFIDNSYQETKELVSEYKLEESVDFTGVLSKEDWIKISNDYNVFMNTTNVDNTPVSVIEAMALGLPIFSTNVGGLPFLIQDAKDGYLSEKNDPNTIAANIIKMFEGNQANTSLEARKKVEQFDWNTVKHQWLKLINSK